MLWLIIVSWYHFTHFGVLSMFLFLWLFGNAFVFVAFSSNLNCEVTSFDFKLHNTKRSLQWLFTSKQTDHSHRSSKFLLLETFRTKSSWNIYNKSWWVIAIILNSDYIDIPYHLLFVTLYFIVICIVLLQLPLLWSQSDCRFHLGNINNKRWCYFMFSSEVCRLYSPSPWRDTIASVRGPTTSSVATENSTNDKSHSWNHLFFYKCLFFCM